MSYSFTVAGNVIYSVPAYSHDTQMVASGETIKPDTVCAYANDGSTGWFNIAGSAATIMQGSESDYHYGYIVSNDNTTMATAVVRHARINQQVMDTVDASVRDAVAVQFELQGVVLDDGTVPAIVTP